MKKHVVAPGRGKATKPQDKKQKKMGRPTKFSTKMGGDICERISKGEAMIDICKEEKMPSARTVYNWLLEATDAEEGSDLYKFLHLYHRARGAQAEYLFEELLKISDDSLPESRTGDAKRAGAKVQAMKLRVETRKWIIARLAPHKYGEKLDVTSGGKAIKANAIVFKGFDGATSE